jgi:signal transduction histidine kinase
MEFVTTVSHELRTPLTIISSAADNIAQGVVQDRAQVTRYGSVISNQVRQLSALVEQILLFARHSRTPQRFTLQPLAVGDIIDATLASTEGLLRAAHFTIERDVEADLPLVMGDKVALAQCLQNLITNAVKYGRDQQWLGIRARLVERGPGEREIQISVSDRGIGIAKADLPHIFEPFYRSPAVTTAQIHGTGLGLSLAKDTAEAIGGRLTVSSDPGRGTTFTLHLPCWAGASADLEPDLDASGVRQHG